MNIFLFFYLFILFVLLTPGTLITLSIMKSSPYSKFIVAAIHGFLFSVIAITTYSFVNELYNSWLYSIKEGVTIDNGYTFTSTDGPKEFNTLSTTPPSKKPSQDTSGPNIKCGSHKFCASAEPNTQKVFCYGDRGGCLWGQNSCNTDNDCKKYDASSPKYTDYTFSASNICSRYPRNSWPGEICQLSGIPVSDEERKWENQCIYNFRYNKDGGENVTCPSDKPTCAGFINGRSWGHCV